MGGGLLAVALRAIAPPYRCSPSLLAVALLAVARRHAPRVRRSRSPVPAEIRDVLQQVIEAVKTSSPAPLDRADQAVTDRRRGIRSSDRPENISPAREAPSERLESTSPAREMESERLESTSPAGEMESDRSESISPARKTPSERPEHGGPRRKEASDRSENTSPAGKAPADQSESISPAGKTPSERPEPSFPRGDLVSPLPEPDPAANGHLRDRRARIICTPDGPAVPQGPLLGAAESPVADDGI